jgi:hypothetical protein
MISDIISMNNPKLGDQDVNLKSESRVESITRGWVQATTAVAYPFILVV